MIDEDLSFGPWRGFNLQQKYMLRWGNFPFDELDFQWLKNWGFDFVRLPMDYRQWIVSGDYYNIKEKVLKEIDQAVVFGRKYRIHVDFNFHRAPGYCVHGADFEPLNLWRDEEALEACEYHWRLFAERYKGIPSKEVSFNLVNEPLGSDISDRGADMETYKRFVVRMIRAIREVDPDRLVIADGLITKGHYEPVPGIVDPLFGQSFHMYEPGWLTHLGASWAHAWYEYKEQPKYPGVAPKLDEYLKKAPADSRDRGAYERYLNVRVDKAWLENYAKPYFDLKEKGTFVHCSELGVYNKVVDRQSQLNWYRDVLDILTSHNVGWAQWDFKGPFGIINTGRKEFHSEALPNGDHLDRELLNLIQKYMK